MAFLGVKRQKYLGIDDFNKLLRNIKGLGYKIIYGPYLKGDTFHTLCDTAFIEDKISKIFVTTKIGTKPLTYVFDKACSALEHDVNGLTAFRTLSRYYKVPRVSQENALIDSASSLLYFNKKYNNTRQYAYGYDMNSAYSWGMLQEMPKDTDKGPINSEPRVVEPGEIGFSIGGDLVLEGEYADYIFKAEESPFKKFVEIWYGRKRKAKNKVEKQKAKDVLNMSIGWLQRANYWYRAAIIGHCNRRMGQLISKYKGYVLHSNTDSIVSTIRIPELDSNLGTDVGQWKLEHVGMFAYKDLVSQWDSAVPTYRGTPKSWFKDDFDLLEDSRPTEGNKYYFDEKDFIMKEMKYGKK